jgi:dTDP-4-amino-4,6-dideoxygalactose transaminase
MLRNTDLNFQHAQLKDELLAMFQDLLNENQFIGGSIVAEFERAFSKKIGSGFSLGVGNGTDALEIAIMALDLKEGSKVIVPANSFVASAEAVVNAGYIPVFADVDESMNIDTESLERVFTNDVSAVIFVPLYGNPTNVDKVLDFCRAHNLALIEDCAQSHFAELDGTKSGDFGDISAFSFFPGKNFGALGDGGLIYSKSKNLAERARIIANHGRVERDNHEKIGRNSRLDSIQAGFLNVKLQIADEMTSSRRKNASRYQANLSMEGGLLLPQVSDNAAPVYHQFVIRCESRDQLQNYLIEKNIEARVIYPKAIPLHSAFEDHQEGEWGNAERFSSEILSLPVGEHLTLEDIDFVSSAVKGFFKQGS